MTLLIVESDKYLRDFLTRDFECRRYLVLAAVNEIDSLALLAQLVSGDHVSTQQARALAYDVYVYKPFDLEELLYQVTMLAGVPASTNQRESSNRRRGA